MDREQTGGCPGTGVGGSDRVGVWELADGNFYRENG